MVAPRKKPAHRRPLLFPPLLDSRSQRCGFRESEGRVRRLLRFSLTDGKRRKSRKPAPLPTHFPNMLKIRMSPVYKDACGLPAVGSVLPWKPGRIMETE